jgi:4-hydroxybenzoate polyprenyltransferase
MDKLSKTDFMLRELSHFILHLRLHYQFLLLSGGYLLGGLMAGTMDTFQFWLQFLNVHVLLYGGATAFNSYWDKDEGPIGGLKNPPKMTRWMHPASLLLMFAGWAWAWQVDPVYFLVYGVSLVLFWLYSTPHFRWKGKPVLSLVAIGFSTGFNSVLMGSLAAGGSVDAILLLAATGASMVLLSLYPVSQIYQAAEDEKRGDRTFTMHFGIAAVKRFFLVTFFGGLVLFSSALSFLYPIPATALVVVGSLAGVVIREKIVSLTGNESEYNEVMRVKFIASLSFVMFLLISNTIRYGWIELEALSRFF